MDYRAWVIAILCLLLGACGGFILGERYGRPETILHEVLYFDAADSWDITAEGPIFQSPNIIRADPADCKKP